MRRYVRVNAGSPRVTERRVPAPLLEALDELADAAADRDLGLLVENHGGQSSDPEFLLALVERIGSGRLGIVLDLGNFQPVLDALDEAKAGNRAPTPLTSAELQHVDDGIASLAPFATLVHAKSYGWDSDGHPLLVDPAETLAIAIGAGFEGRITVEYEGDAGDPWIGTQHLLDVVHRYTR